MAFGSARRCRPPSIGITDRPSAVALDAAGQIDWDPVAKRLYHGAILPRVEVRLDRWAARAAEIADPAWSEIARSSLERKRFHSRGGSIFVTLALRAGRPIDPILDRLVALQVGVDFLDDVSDSANWRDPRVIRDLHFYLLGRQPGAGAVLPAGPLAYLADLRAVVGGGLVDEPSYPVVAAWLQQSLGYCVRMQTINQLPPGFRERRARRWAERHHAADQGLTWQEHQAGHGSTIPVFLALALAGQPDLNPAEVAELRAAYEPWLVTLHILLDSLIDAADDARTGDMNFVADLPAAGGRADRLAEIARTWGGRIAGLPEVHFHAFVFETMVRLYLSRSEPDLAARLLAEQAGAIGKRSFLCFTA